MRCKIFPTGTRMMTLFFMIARNSGSNSRTVEKYNGKICGRTIVTFSIDITLKLMLVSFLWSELEALRTENQFSIPYYIENYYMQWVWGWNNKVSLLRLVWWIERPLVRLKSFRCFKFKFLGQRNVIKSIHMTYLGIERQKGYKRENRRNSSFWSRNKKKCLRQKLRIFLWRMWNRKKKKLSSEVPLSPLRGPFWVIDFNWFGTEKVLSQTIVVIRCLTPYIQGVPRKLMKHFVFSPCSTYPRSRFTKSFVVRLWKELAIRTRNKDKRRSLLSFYQRTKLFSFLSRTRGRPLSRRN